MNEQVSQKAEKVIGTAPALRSGLIGWLLRVTSILVILAACVLIAFFAYQDLSGQSAVVSSDIESTDIESSDVESVVIKEVAPEDAISVDEVDLTSITSCISQEIIDDAEHPLAPLLQMAKYGVGVINENVQDYTACITKRVRYQGRLQPEERIFCKIRHANDKDDSATPFSVYTRFINPKPGQEAIWVEGQYDDKLVAHGPTGFLNLLTVHLEPESKMAMTGNRYPIKTIGMLNLIKQMIKQGSNDINYEDCEVKITRNLMVNSARCTKLEVIHHKPADHFDFHRAEIYIDDDRNLPIAFRSFLWPDKPNGRPKLQESYYYTDIKINVGLTDADFDPANEKYEYPEAGL